ncbi:MAG TPA: PEP-CTERM sorting domain-containing protein, partial [Pirellulales bacterium]
DLGTLLGGAFSRANGINNSGQVVGIAATAGGQNHAFLYSGGAMQDLGTLGGTNSQAQGINNSGKVVGYGTTAGGQNHAFLYSGGGSIQDLNSLIDPLSGWTLDVAQGVNDAGQIVGYGEINGQTHAFLLTPVPEPTTLGLGALGGFALLTMKRRRKIAQ